MSIRESTPVESDRGLVDVYPPRPDLEWPVDQKAKITSPWVTLRFVPEEARLLAQTICPDLDPEKVKDTLTKPYRDKAAAAHAELTETIESWGRTLQAARTADWSGFLVADSMEELLLALSEPLVTLREMKDGDL